ncbi:MAG: hypothetical protein ONB23_13200 [candidate division KSB1 bacterium]|nr:hypothetical protein [candidate division KSB1 bacterium]
MQGKACLVILAILNFWAACQAQAAGETMGLGASMLARGFVPDPWGTDPESWICNPSLLDPRGGFQVGAGYVSLYGLPALTVRSLALGTGLGPVGLGWSIGTFGWQAYRETNNWLGFSIGPGPLRLGGSLLISRSWFRNYGATTSLGTGAGALLVLSPAFRVSFASCYLDLGRNEALIRQSFAQIAWKGAFPLFVSLSLVKEVGFPVEWRAGFEYSLRGRLFLRAGATGGPERITAGIGFAAGRARLNYAFVDHAQLGATHAVSLDISGPR